MTVGALQSRPGLHPNQSVKVKERLLDMQEHAFYQLTCDDRFEQVGQQTMEWDEKSFMEAFKRTAELASDPAKGNKIVDGTLEEAAVALTAERQGVIGRATRETTGSAEFIDDKGVEWDVKSPLSPPPGQNWSYSPNHQLDKIRHDLGQGDKVLFNLSRVNDKDRDDTLRLLKSELNCSERSQLLILTDPEVAVAA